MKVTAGNVPAANAQADMGQFESDFINIKDRAVTYYKSLTPVQRGEVDTALNSWGSLTTLAGVVQRTDALLRIMSLLFIGLWLVYLEVQRLKEIVSSLEK